MYTRLTFWADFDADSPAIPIIEALMEGDEPSEAPDHDFFRATHCWAVLRCSSYYHRTGESVFVYDDIARKWWLNSDASLKNYGNEIKLFLDWVHPYDSGDNGFRGFFIYEEDEHPTLIYRTAERYELRPATGEVDRS